MKTQFWVGVRKDRYEKHDVFASDGEPSDSEYPQYDYVIGPYVDEADAKKRANTEKNCTGTFVDPFCNNGQGR